MKLLLIIALLFGSCATTFDHAPAPVRALQSAVFNLKLNDRTICTVFAVESLRKEHYMISAGHCATDLVPSDALVAYSPETGARYSLRLKTYAQSWPNVDFSIFNYVDDSKFAPVSTHLTKEVPSLGDQVWSFGGPKGIAPILTGALYAGRARRADVPDSEINGMYAISSVMAAPGSSGSPVMDDEGRVWGILVGGNPTIPGFAMVVLVPQEY